MSRSTGRAIPPCWPSLSATCSASWATCVWRSRTGGNAGPDRRGTGRACSRCFPSRSRGAGRSRGVPALARRRSLHLRGLQHLPAGDGRGRETQLRRIKGTGLGILRGHDDGARSPSFAELGRGPCQARQPSPWSRSPRPSRAARSTAPPISTMSASSASVPMAWSWASTASWASSPPPPIA